PGPRTPGGERQRHLAVRRGCPVPVAARRRAGGRGRCGRDAGAPRRGGAPVGRRQWRGTVADPEQILYIPVEGDVGRGRGGPGEGLRHERRRSGLPPSGYGACSVALPSVSGVAPLPHLAGGIWGRGSLMEGLRSGSLTAEGARRAVEAGPYASFVL